MASVLTDRVSKRFTLRRDRADSVGQLLIRMIPSRRPPAPEPFWALRDVSFSMDHGRSLGIIGHNGAGKSTLLKLLTRTMLPTSGIVQVHGRTSALIELGAGFHPDFTGRENIVLNASILGVSRRDIDRRMDDIIDFSGISPFIDTPVKYYSSGMHARLGFSVAINVDPEILIVDEVLAVGDQAFQERCMSRIFEMKRLGVGILLVTHSLDAVETLMDGAVWLDHGTAMAQGTPRDVVHAYRRHAARLPSASDGPVASAQVGTRGVDAALSIVNCVATGADGRTPVGSGSAMRVSMELHNDSSAALSVHVRVLLQRPDGLTVCEFSTRRWAEALTIPVGRHTVILRVEDVAIAAGNYDLTALITDQAGATLCEDAVVGRVAIWANSSPMGLCLLHHSWGVE